MREAMAVTGYIPAKEVKALRKAESIEIRPERDIADVVVRVAGKDIEEVREGSTEGSLTAVQVILRQGATVETVHRVKANPAGMKAFHDPVLNRVRQEASAKVIMI
jgi:hypothetical protein